MRLELPIAVVLLFPLTVHAQREKSPHEAKAAVLVNQVGYDSGENKIAVFQMRDPQQQEAPTTFEVVEGLGKVAFRGKLAPRGRVHAGKPGDWGANYWTADFTNLRRTGTFRVRVSLESGEALSFPFEIGGRVLFGKTAFAAARFFYWQRCGYRLPGFHEACHLDDARIPEGRGGHLDATGGWHDAGDFNKYASIACRSVYALTALARTGSRFLNEQERKAVLEEATWGADWLRKMWQDGKGTMYHDVWSGYHYHGVPEKETDNVPGNTDDRPLRGEGANAMTAAALAAIARETGRRDYREAAEDLWLGAVKSLPVDSEDPWVKTCNGVPNLGHDVEGRLVRRTADLLVADLEITFLTGDPKYANGAQERASALVRLQNADGLWPSDVYSRTVLQGMPAAALVLYIRAYSKSGVAPVATSALRRWLDRTLRLADSPFEITPWAEGVFFNPHVIKLWSVGHNSQYLSEAWALYLAADLLRSDRARRLATRQIDWVLGTNPLNLCMMEGAGSYNPPFTFHMWGSAAGKWNGSVKGGIPNGIRSDDAGHDTPYFQFLMPKPGVFDYRSTENWEPHNAFYVLALLARQGVFGK